MKVRAVTTSRPEGPTGEGSSRNTGRVPAWRGPPTGAESRSKGTHPSHQDPSGRSQKNLTPISLSFHPPVACLCPSE